MYFPVKKTREAVPSMAGFDAYFGLQAFLFRGLNFITSLFETDLNATKTSVNVKARYNA